MDSARIAKVSRIDSRHFQDARSVVFNFSGEEIAIQGRTVPMRVQLKADSVLRELRHLRRIHVVQDAPGNQLVVGKAELSRQQLEKVVLFGSLQLFPLGKLCNGPPRAEAACFIG